MKQSNSKRNNLVLQGSILAISALVARFIGFIYKIPLANVLSDEANSVYGIASNIYIFFLFISTMGFPNAISKVVSEKLSEKKYKEAQYFLKSSMILAGFIGLFFTLLMWFGAVPISNMFGSKSNTLAIRALAPALFIFAILAVLRGYFQGMNSMVPTAISQVVEQIFNALFSLILVYALISKGDEVAAAGGSFATGIGALAGLVVMVLVYWAARDRIIKKRVQRDTHDFRPKSMVYYWKIVIMISGPIIIGGTISQLTNVIDNGMFKNLLILRKYTDSAASAMNGIYIMKHQPIITLPTAISSAFMTASVPSIASLIIKNQRDEVANKISSTIKVILLVTMPAVIGIFVLAKPINQMLFPSSDSALLGQLLMIGSVSVITFSLSNLSIGILQGLGKLHVQVITAIVGLFSKIIFNLILVYAFNLNIYGVVIANTLFSFVLCILNFRAVYKVIPVKISVTDVILKPFLASAIMGVVCYVFHWLTISAIKSNTVATLFAVAIGVVVYAIALLKIGGLSREEIVEFPKGVKILGLLEKLHLI